MSETAELAILWPLCGAAIFAWVVRFRLREMRPDFVMFSMFLGPTMLLLVAIVFLLKRMDERRD